MQVSYREEGHLESRTTRSPRRDIIKYQPRQWCKPSNMRQQCTAKDNCFFTSPHSNNYIVLLTKTFVLYVVGPYSNTPSPQLF